MYHYITENNNNKGMDATHKVSTTTSRMESQTVTFRDGPSGWASSLSEGTDSTRFNTVHNDVSLADFFARPIPIYKYEWIPGAVQTLIPYFDPWSLFINNPRVGNRMTNYALMHSKLHLKFMVNGNSFYYGRMMPFYVPQQTKDTAFSAQDVQQKMLASQRLKLFIDPCESCAGTMDVPMILPSDMVTLPYNTISELGRVGMLEMSPLYHANGATTSIEISVYAWMTDVKLAAPTMADISTLVPQSGGGEFGTSPVSFMASTVASATGMLAQVPVIGKYMKATSMVSSALGQVAQLFGFSRPSIIADVMQNRTCPISMLAVTNGGDPSCKLTVDTKQELSIDPSIVGLGSEDELVFTSIASRETYEHTFPWTVAGLPGALLDSIGVTPCRRNVNVVGGNDRYTIPACAYAALPFDYWRGTMRFRFQIVASAYHKGRLQFVWDPVGTAGTPEPNVAYTKIVDLANERDFVLDVSWGANTTFLTTGFSSLPAYSLTTNLSSASYNGTLNIYILNSLAVPNSAVYNDISVNVFVSMCEDAEFSSPNERVASLVINATLPTGLVPQSGDVEDMETMEDAPVATESTENILVCSPTSDYVSSVYFGERVVSFRQLMKRFYYLTSLSKMDTTSTYTNWVHPNFPITRGYTDKGIYGTAPAKYNVCKTTILNYLSYAFLMYRGGFRYKYIHSPTSTGLMANAYVSRNTPLVNYSTYVPIITVVDSTNELNMTSQAVLLKPDGQRGSAATNGKVQPSLEVEVPFISNYRFAYARTDENSLNTARDHQTHTFSCQQVGLSCIDVHVSGAEDLTFHMFQGCRPFYVAASFPI